MPHSPDNACPIEPGLFVPLTPRPTPHPPRPRPHAEQRVIAAIAVVAALFAVYAVRSADPDLWGHLRYGKYVLDNGGRVGADPFAYTTVGRTWNDHEYLAQVALWLAYAGA